MDIPDYVAEVISQGYRFQHPSSCRAAGLCNQRGQDLSAIRVGLHNKIFHYLFAVVGHRGVNRCLIDVGIQLGGGKATP